MLKLPGDMTPESFLARHWQKQALFIKGALERVHPSVTRNELAWLATLDDVESRLVFVEQSGSRKRYRTETGPFEPEYLAALPKGNWTLLVHDVEKHLPAMRALFDYVPFVPDWRIDDLMVSFAAPGGGVGPHRDNYDVFLCQGIGIRDWRFSDAAIPADPDASDDLALLEEFDSTHDYDNRQGDVLYLPPGVAHWGVAKRACITYSIGMRAPQASDLSLAVHPGTTEQEAFYRDRDLTPEEARPGYLSMQAGKRAARLLGIDSGSDNRVNAALGRFATQPKDWLRPDGISSDDVASLLSALPARAVFRVHGMAQIAYDDDNLYVNGSVMPLPAGARPLLERICRNRRWDAATRTRQEFADMLRFMLTNGAFEIPENF